MTPPTGTLVRGLVAGRAVRVLGLEARALAEHTRRVHGLGRDAARIGSDALVAAALSGAHIKGDEQLTLQFQGERPRCALYVDVNTEGHVRVRVSPADLRLGADPRITGILAVTKHAPGGELYRGATSIDDRTLEHGIGAHFGDSQQVDAIVRLGSGFADDGELAWAGGLLLERLPEEPGLPSISAAAFAERYGWVRDAEVEDLLFGLAVGKLGGETLELLRDPEPVVWQCRCSPARAERALSAFGVDELRALIDEDHGALVSCHFCGAEHAIDEDRLRAILAAVRAAAD